MTVSVPAPYVQYVQLAALDTGLPYQICAAQAYVESDFNPNAVSKAGAEGFWQFLPSTFAEYGTGSPFNVADETGAYINFMRALLRQFGGNIRNSLAAYNAGPGNVAAGLPYADEIIRLAGSSQAVVSQNATPVAANDTGPPVMPTSDDASWWIYKSGQHLNELASTCNYYASAIGRL